MHVLLRVCKQPQLQQGRWVSNTGSKTLCLVWKHYWRAKTLALHRKSVRIAGAACSSLAGVDVLWSWSHTVPGESCWIKQMHRHNITAIAIAQSYFMCCGLVYLKLPGVNHPTAVSAPHLLCDKEHKKQLRPLLPSQAEVMLLYSSHFAAGRKHFWYKTSRNLFSRVRLGMCNTHQVSPEQTEVQDFWRALSSCEYTTLSNSRKLKVHYCLAAITLNCPKWQYHQTFSYLN